MSLKLTTTTVLGVSLSGALFAGLVGCTPEESTAQGVTETTSTTAEELRLGGGDDDRNRDCDGDKPPTARRGVKDPGVRGGAPGAGEPIDGLNVNELALFNRGKFRTVEREATCDTCNDIPQGSPIPPNAPFGTTNSAGAGARFNSTSCTLDCHSYPTIGGTSPFKNPLFKDAGFKGAKNKIPFFLQADGPVREPRFIYHPDGTRDGAVHQMFTVTGRSDAPKCDLAQPDFEGNRNNISLRIPTPLFGLGLIDSIQDKEIKRHQASHPERKRRLGIAGLTNTSANDATISRFGWKAQNKSVTQFAGEAYNVELGISNDLNPTATDETEECLLTEEPADQPHTGLEDDPDVTARFNDPVNVLPVWMTFVTYIRVLDAPKPGRQDSSAKHGEELFHQVGCSECHVEAMHTRKGNGGPLTEALRGKRVALYSDLLVHHMGATLADNLVQGAAGPDQFRSSPLWGVGQRVFFLHDGRTNSLVDAILAHYSNPSRAHGIAPAYPASEANKVIENFADLSGREQQDLVNFLRTL